MTETTDTSTPLAPKIEFPCERYPIKVIGDAGDDEAVLRDFPQIDLVVGKRHGAGLRKGLFLIDAQIV